MDIYMDEKAKEYIRDKSLDKSIYITLIRRGGWVGVSEPSVKIGKPDRLNSYDIYIIEDISVYILKEIGTLNNNIKIKNKKFLWKQFLEVEGLKIKQI